jgi:hypothetical protein
MRKTHVGTEVALLVGAVLFALPGCERVAAPAAALLQPATSVPVQAEAVQPAKNEPSLSAMSLAEPPSKLGAPVDLRYSVEGDLAMGQPVTLHLAAVPRVAGSNMEVSIKEEAGISTSSRIGQMRVQKADASAAVRQSMSVTRQSGGPSSVRVLVTMETPEGSAHSWFTVPLARAPAAEKAVKARLE